MLVTLMTLSHLGTKVLTCYMNPNVIEYKTTVKIFHPSGTKIKAASSLPEWH